MEFLPCYRVRIQDAGPVSLGMLFDTIPLVLQHSRCHTGFEGIHIEGDEMYGRVTFNPLGGGRLLLSRDS